MSEETKTKEEYVPPCGIPLAVCVNACCWRCCQVDEHQEPTWTGRVHCD